MTQVQAGELLGIRQPHVSALMRCRPATFSIGRLMEFLTALDQDVEISIHPKPDDRPEGEISVTTAEAA